MYDINYFWSVESTNGATEEHCSFEKIRFDPHNVVHIITNMLLTCATCLSLSLYNTPASLSISFNVGPSVVDPLVILLVLWQEPKTTHKHNNPNVQIMLFFIVKPHKQEMCLISTEIVNCRRGLKTDDFIPLDG